MARAMPAGYGKGGFSSPAAASFAGSPKAPNFGKGAGSKGAKGGKGGKGSMAMMSPQSDLKFELGPDDPPPYGDLRYSTAYWDARHAAVGDLPFDWYMGYDRMAGILRQRLPPASSGAEILDLGVGTSEVPACLHADGWTNVTAIDTSVVAVTRARSARRHVGRSELQFLQMDACKTEFPEKCFDAVIDKGLMDTLVTGGHAFPRVRDMLSEVYKLLRPGGVYFCVSHAGAATRLPYLAHDSTKPWRIEVARVEKGPAPEEGVLPDEEVPDDAGGGFFHIYICTKPDQYGVIPHARAAHDAAVAKEEAEAEAAALAGASSPEMTASSTLMPVAGQSEPQNLADSLGDDSF